MSDSWVDIVESENTFTENILLTNNISAGDILIQNVKNISDLKLLEYQSYLSSILKKYVTQCIDNGNVFNYELHIQKLIWLSDASSELSSRMNMSINTNLPDSLIRSSYKFCEYGHKCKFYYKLKGCYAQHYVHNMVYSDIMAVINHLSSCEINYPELLKSLTTISFVIKHMFEELKKIN